MTELFVEDGVYLIRILLAIVCGAVIGYERQQRVKMAGLRTHILISMSAALMMIISKYGFIDVMGQPGLSCDVSRVAAGIITGVGILSGGIIFIGKRGNVSGITTAAGIWATIGIGMCLGAGMYLLGITAVLLVEAVQMLLHHNLKVYRHPTNVLVTFKSEDGMKELEPVEAQLASREIATSGWRFAKKGKTGMVVHCQLTFPKKYERREIVEVLAQMPEVSEFEIV